MEEISVSDRSTGVELAALFGHLVRLEIELWDRVDHRLRQDHDLPLSRFEPMEVMGRVPGCRVADIAQALSITVGGTSKLVDRIEQSGWCRRTPNPGDARSSLLGLTRPGRRLLGAARRSFEDELERSLGVALPPEHLASLSTTLGAVRQRLADTPRATR
ncbi:MAG: MarR family transcriptional regulator [Acidimicrobiales bacterium]